VTGRWVEAPTHDFMPATLENAWELCWRALVCLALGHAYRGTSPAWEGDPARRWCDRCWRGWEWVG
jgi:hypothetical protein